MHNQVKDFCESIKAKYPEHFVNKDVLDVGSLDINGNNRYLFEGGTYIGVDLGEGPNVDIVGDFSKYPINENFGVVISTEMLEHCKDYQSALINMQSALKTGGLLLITAAGEGRPEHGTTNTSPQDAPFTNDYYKNIIESDFECILNNFEEYKISKEGTDIQFYGIKK